MIPVTRLGDGAVAYVKCGFCGSFDVTYERMDWVDEHAGPNDRRRYLTDVVTCESEGCPEQKMDPLWRDAESRLPELGATVTVVSDIPPSVRTARTRYRLSGRRAQVLVALLRGGAQDGHQIAARVGCDHNQVGTRAKELEAAGYVERVGRRKGPRDGAKVTVYTLTVDGRHAATQMANAQDRNAA